MMPPSAAFPPSALAAVVTASPDHLRHVIFTIGLVLVGLGAVITIILTTVTRAFERRTGVSADAEVVASDTGQQRVKKIWDPATGLYGQPDYVLREEVGWSKKLVPVELKPTRKGQRLYESDEMQLTTYMILLRAEYGDEFAGYGYVRYKDANFTVELTEARIRRCLELRDAVRADRRATNVHRTHNIRGRCAGCSMRSSCGESLAD